jgi:aconitate hydratase
VKEALSGAARRAPRAADEKTFEVIVRVDTPQEVEYYRNGGILPYVLRQIATAP